MNQDNNYKLALKGRKQYIEWCDYQLKNPDKAIRKSVPRTISTF